jgi:hypothetical protein
MKNNITNFMELSSSQEAASCAAALELPSILWNPKFIIMFTRAYYWSLSSASSVLDK